MQSRSEFCWNWAHIGDEQGGALQVHVGPGAMHTLTLNQLPAQGFTVEIYDGVGGGTLIGVLTTDLSQPRSLTYNLAFTAGLWIIAQYCDLTVTYI